MKTIRILGICLLMTMVGMGLQSCSKDEYQSRLKELIIKDLEFTSDDNEYSKTFRNEDLSHYQASTPESSWCKVTLNASTSTMTVSVSANDTNDSRIAKVTLRDITDGVTTRSFTVTQAQNDVIKIGEGEYSVSTEGGDVVINVESNVTYQVEIVNADWIHLPGSAGTRGLVKSQVVLTVDKNTSQKSRSATVRIYDKKSGAEDQIIISQKFEPKFELMKTSYTIDEKGGEVEVLIQTNLNSFAVYIDDSWAKNKGRETMSDDLVKQVITISSFDKKEASRSTTVSFVEENHGIDESISITQTRKLFIKEENVEIMAAGSQALTLHNESGWSVSWKSGNKKVATVDDNGKVTGVSAGKTKVYVSYGSHKDSVNIVVNDPESLDDYLSAPIERNEGTVEGVSDILTSLDCMLYNNSAYDIEVTKFTLYCDGKSSKTSTPSSPITLKKNGGQYSKNFEIDVEYDEVEVSATRADGDESGDSEGEGDDPKPVTKKVPKKNTHEYYVVWYYKYGGKSFEFKSETSSGGAAATRSRRSMTR